jgi:hypothetical protein
LHILEHFQKFQQTGRVLSLFIFQGNDSEKDQLQAFCFSCLSLRKPEKYILDYIGQKLWTSFNRQGSIHIPVSFKHWTSIQHKERYNDQVFWKPEQLIINRIVYCLWKTSNFDTFSQLLEVEYLTDINFSDLMQFIKDAYQVRYIFISVNDLSALPGDFRKFWEFLMDHHCKNDIFFLCMCPEQFHLQSKLPFVNVTNAEVISLGNAGMSSNCPPLGFGSNSNSLPFSMPSAGGFNTSSVWGNGRKTSGMGNSNASAGIVGCSSSHTNTQAPLTGSTFVPPFSPPIYSVTPLYPRSTASGTATFPIPTFHTPPITHDNGRTPLSWENDCFGFHIGSKDPKRRNSFRGSRKRK